MLYLNQQYYILRLCGTTYIHLLGLYVNIACVLWSILTLSVKGNKTIGLSP